MDIISVKGLDPVVFDDNTVISITSPDVKFHGPMKNLHTLGWWDTLVKSGGEIRVIRHFTFFWPDGPLSGKLHQAQTKFEVNGLWRL